MGNGAHTSDLGSETGEEDSYSDLDGWLATHDSEDSDEDTMDWSEAAAAYGAALAPVRLVASVVPPPLAIRMAVPES